MCKKCKNLEAEIVEAWDTARGWKSEFEKMSEKRDKWSKLAIECQEKEVARLEKEASQLEKEASQLDREVSDMGFTPTKDLLKQASKEKEDNPEKRIREQESFRNLLDNPEAAWKEIMGQEGGAQ